MNTLIEDKMQDTTLLVDRTEHTAQLKLNITDVFKLEIMMNEVHELSMYFLNENHDWFNHRINDEIKKDTNFRETNIRLATFVNKAMLIIGQNGDFAGALYTKISETTSKI